MKTKRSFTGDKLLDVVIYTIILLFCASIVLPFVMIISSSFTSVNEMAQRGRYILFPLEPTISAYHALLGGGSLVFICYWNTIKRVLLGSVLNLLFTSALAYGLSKKTVPGRNFFITLIFITMFFSGGLIPSYLLVTTLGLRDSIWSLVLPGLVSASHVILMKSFFSSIDPAIEEAAIMDGANEVLLLFRIILPISKPLLATIALYCIVSHWNAWFDAFLYISDYKKLPIQNMLRGVVIQTDMRFAADSVGPSHLKPTSMAVKNASIVLTSLPIVCVYPFLQKYFVKGIMIGSIKG